jgi:hypothetical protein
MVDVPYTPADGAAGAAAAAPPPGIGDQAVPVSVIDGAASPGLGDAGAPTLGTGGDVPGDEGAPTLVELAGFNRHIAAASDSPRLAIVRGHDHLGAIVMLAPLRDGQHPVSR